MTIAGNVVKYLRYWKTALKNRAFRCCFQREGDGESPSAGLSAASLERPRESAAGASRYRSAEICASIIRVVPRLTSPLSQGRGFIFVGADAHIGPAERTVFTVIPGEFATFFGPTESSAPTSRFRPPARCRGGRLCPPAGYTDFTGIFGEFVCTKAPLGHKGPIPPVRGKWPEGPIGVGMLSAKLTEGIRTLQILESLRTSHL